MSKCSICGGSIRAHHYTHPNGSKVCSAMCYERLEKKLSAEPDGLQLEFDFDDEDKWLVHLRRMQERMYQHDPPSS
jgi:hypothetical protein